MIRVGFVVADSGKGWMGGINYLSNLLHAVMAQPDRKVSPVLLAAPSVPDSVVATLPADEVLRTSFVVPSHPAWYLRKLSERALSRDLPMESYLRAKGIAALSHSGHLGPRASVPTLVWLPDFQHRHLPHLFEPKDRAARDRAAWRASEAATRIVVSSGDAMRDLGDVLPAAIVKSRVLRFVSGFGGVKALPNERSTRERYGLDGPYFHLPNQFWAHKNHRVAVDALACLRRHGLDATIVATGHTDDTRNPGFFPDLMRHVRESGVEDRFRVLGLVPYGDLAGLMRYAVAVINPSLFEGWSTTVEEAKSQGKTLILSDIPVHREQAPPRGIFFGPDDPGALAEVLADVLGRFSESQEREAARHAAADLPARFADFALTYERIVVEAVTI